MGISRWCRSREPKSIWLQRQLRGGGGAAGGTVEGRRKTVKGKEGGEGYLLPWREVFKQLLIRLCCSAPPFPFFSSASLPPSLSLSPSPSVRQPFRQEICALRVRLWTFLLQSFYAVRHTQGWETLSPKHRERILAGKEIPLFGFSCCGVWGCFFCCCFFAPPPSLPNPAWRRGSSSASLQMSRSPLEHMMRFNA